MIREARDMCRLQITLLQGIKDVVKNAKQEELTPNLTFDETGKPCCPLSKFAEDTGQLTQFKLAMGFEISRAANEVFGLDQSLGLGIINAFDDQERFENEAGDFDPRTIDMRVKDVLAYCDQEITRLEADIEEMTHVKPA